MPKPLESIAKDKIYVNVELCDGGMDDQTYGMYYYGPFSNLTEASNCYSEIDKIHKDQNDGRSYTRRQTVYGEDITHINPLRIITPEMIKEKLKAQREIKLMEDREENTYLIKS